MEATNDKPADIASDATASSWDRVKAMLGSEKGEKKSIAQLKLRYDFGSKTMISEGPIGRPKWPEQASKYGVARSARNILDAMGVHRSANDGKSRLNASASGEYGDLELRPGVRFGEGTEHKRTEPMLLIRKGARTLTLAHKKKTKGRSSEQKLAEMSRRFALSSTLASVSRNIHHAAGDPARLRFATRSATSEPYTDGRSTTTPLGEQRSATELGAVADESSASIPAARQLANVANADVCRQDPSDEPAPTPAFQGPLSSLRFSSESLLSPAMMKIALLVAVLAAALVQVLVSCGGGGAAALYGLSLTRATTVAFPSASPPLWPLAPPPAARGRRWCSRTNRTERRRRHRRS